MDMDKKSGYSEHKPDRRFLSRFVWNELMFRQYGLCCPRQSQLYFRPIIVTPGWFTSETIIILQSIIGLSGVKTEYSKQ